MRVRLTRAQQRWVNTAHLWLVEGYTLFRSPGLDEDLEWWIGTSVIVPDLTLPGATFEVLRVKRILVRNLERSRTDAWIYDINPRIAIPLTTCVVRWHE